MGKKLPGKNHKGVKDPRKQQRNREELIKNKINCKPDDLEDQPFPKSLKNLIRWQKLGVDQDLMKKKKRRKGLVDSRLLTDKEETVRGMTVPEKSVPAFIQQQGESNQNFLRRVDRVCEDVVNEAGYSNKFKFDPTTNSAREEEEEEGGQKKGKREKGERGNVEELMTLDGTKKKKKLKEGELSKKEKMKARTLGKKQSKRSKVQEKMQERNRFRDNIAFGEVVHAPPVLNIPARNQIKVPIETKPGKRGLLLNHILHPDKLSHAVKPIQSATGKKTKAKSLPMAERERMERNRVIAVEAYRRLKLSQANK